MKVGLVDTNVLVYAAVGFESERTKWQRAHDLLERAPHCLSAQNLAEFASVMTRKFKRPLAEIAEWLEYFETLEVAPVDRRIVLDGLAIVGRYKINYYDAALVAAAKALRLDTLYTEDLQHGQSYDGVMATDPFLDH